MMRARVMGVLHAEIRGLHQAAYLLAFFTLGSQILAIVRDRLLAHTFGAGQTLDLYYAAFRIPDTLYVLVASLVSVFVLVPYLEEALVRGDDNVRALLSDLLTFFLAGIGILAGVAFLFAPQLCSLLFGSLMQEAPDALVLLVRILLVQPIILGVSNLFAAYVQVRGRFVVYAVAPILYNLGIIVGILFLYPVFGVVGLAYGVLLGSVLHLAVQASYLFEVGMLPRLQVPQGLLVWRIVSTSLPRACALSANQMALLGLVSLASVYAAGSVASFSLAYNLQAVPLAIIGASYSVAAFPTLARLITARDLERYRALVTTASRQIIFWSLPVIVLFVVLRAQVVRVILGSGNFDWSDTMLTAAALALFVLSLVAQCLVVLLVRSFYAAGKTWTPVVVSVLSAVVTVILAYVLTYGVNDAALGQSSFAAILRVTGVPGVSILYLAGAFTIGSCINAAALMLVFDRTFGSYIRFLVRPTLEALGASMIAGLTTYLALLVLSDIVSMRTVLGVFVQGFSAGVTGIVMWVLVLTALGNREISIAWETALSRFRQTSSRSLRGTIES